MTKSRSRLRIAITLVSLGLTLGNPIRAQESKPLPVEAILNAKQFAPLVPIALAPGGKQIAYTVQDNRRARSFDFATFDQKGIPPWGIGSDIWVQSTDFGLGRSLTGGQGDNWLPVWSPNGRYLAFFSDRGSSGELRLWIWDQSKDELREASSANVRGNQIEWTRDSEELIVTTAPTRFSLPDGTQETLSRKPAGATSTKDKSTVELFGTAPAMKNAEPPAPGDPWDLDRELKDLVRIDPRTGEAHVLVSQTRISVYRLSPDGRRVAYTVPDRFERAGSQQILFRLAWVGTEDSDSKTLLAGIRLNFDADFSWSPDSQRIAYRVSGPEMVGDSYVVPIDRGEAKNITHLATEEAQFPINSEKPLWDRDGVAIYFVQNGALWRAVLGGSKACKVADIPGRRIDRIIPSYEGFLWTIDDGGSTIVVTHDDIEKQDGFFTIDLRNGASTRLAEDHNCYTCARVEPPVAASQDGRELFYFQENAGRPAELWRATKAFAFQKQISNINSQLETYVMGEAHLIRWLSDDGGPLAGALLLPSSYKQGTRYPLIVWVYGGAIQSDDLDHFGLATSGPFNMQLFATRGYAILLPDMPMESGTPMLDIAKTVLPGVNKVIELGIADPGRLGVMGHSFGGYSTLSLIVQTGRFKAAVEASGFGNAIGIYGEMGTNGTAYGVALEEGRDSMGGTPWETREKYLENSPVLYLDRVQTPLLILHGTEDAAVRPFLGDEIFVDLRRLGKQVWYAKYKGEGHTPITWSYANQVDLSRRIIGWFENYLKPPVTTP